MATSVLGLKTFAASDPVDYNEVNDNYTKIDNGVKTAMQGRAAHNLLDNSNFSIAQAGRNGSHGSTKYVCDRWISWNADATFGSGYITPGSPIDQHLSKTVVDINKTYTAAICLSDGTIKAESGTFSNSFGSYVLGIYCVKQSDSSDYVTVRLNTGNNIRWAALYEGTYTADTLPAYVPKGYAAELAACQRYYKHQVLLPSIKTSGNIYIVSKSFDVPMRAVPTYSFVKADVYGIGTFNDFTECYLSLDGAGVYYALLPTLTSYNNVSLVVNFSCDL